MWEDGQNVTISSESDVGGAFRVSLRIVARLVLFLCVVAGLYFATLALHQRAELFLSSVGVEWAILTLVLATILFSLLLALPFVPGMEMGLAIMMAFGWQGVPLVYFASLAALSLSYFGGARLGAGLLRNLLAWLHLGRAGRLLEEMERLSSAERLQRLISPSAGRTRSFLTRHRYLALMVVFNLPGNALLGGGGGIGMLAGLSGLYTFPRYVGAVALAITPIPALFLLREFLP